jgi:histidinol-phosphatase (PHP family)
MHMLSNFHTHTDYCDGKGSITDYVLEASRLKLKSLGFSSHAPLPFTCAWSMTNEDLSEYLNEIETVRKQLPGVELYKGLEVDYIPGITGASRFRQQLDYAIGSIHFVDQLPDGKPWEIDGAHSLFLEGLQQIFKNDIRVAVGRYFELTREMVKNDCPDIIGHLDKIKIQNKNNQLWEESEDWYRQEIRKTIDLIADAGAIIEINTRGLYQGKTTETYPGIWALHYILEKKIPVTVNSDAHHPNQLTNGFEDTVSQLITLGFKEEMVLIEGRWKSKPLVLHDLP